MFKNSLVKFQIFCNQLFSCFLKYNSVKFRNILMTGSLKSFLSGKTIKRPFAAANQRRFSDSFRATSSHENLLETFVYLYQRSLSIDSRSGPSLARAEECDVTDMMSSATRNIHVAVFMFARPTKSF